MFLSAMSDELLKIAKTRMAREAERAFTGGNIGSLQQLGGAAEQLGLRPRQVADVSVGGAEGAVDLLMGKRKGIQGGLIARKLYDPESILTRQDVTTELIGQKQKATDALRAAAERQGGKVSVPSMSGFDVMHKDKGPGMLRHVSYHEYAPGLKEMPGGMRQMSPIKEVSSALKQKRFRDVPGVARKAIKAQQPLEDTYKVLQEASKATGQNIGDVVIKRVPGGIGHFINPGNVQIGPGGKPTIVDVLPTDKKFFGRLTGQQAAIQRKNVMDAISKGKEGIQGLAMQAIGGEPRSIPGVRREIFNPTKAVSTGESVGTFARRGLREGLSAARKVFRR